MPIQTGGLLSPWLQSRRIAAARPYLIGRVLDYGCGTGDLATYCTPANYLGVDPDEDARREARRRHPAHRFVGQEEIGGEFDRIVGLAVIEHVASPTTFLKDLGARLAPAGKIILTSPLPAIEPIHVLGARLGIFDQHAADDHETLIDARGMREIASRAGFRIVESRRFLFGVNQLFVLTTA